MSTTTEPGPVLAPPRARRDTSPLGLFVTLVLMTSVVYTFVSAGSMGGCLGGISADGGFIDNAGNPTSAAPTCVMIQLSPQPYVYLLLIVLAALTMAVIRQRQQQSLPTKAIMTAGVVAVITVGLLFSVYHFLFVQEALLGDWRSGHDVVLPFLSNATIDRTPWPSP